MKKNTIPKKIHIYGKEGCQFCVNAKKLATYLKEKHLNIEIFYTDAIKEGISKEKLAEILNIEEVKTYPQVIVEYENKEKEYIGGYTDFDNIAEERNWF